MAKNKVDSGIEMPEKVEKIEFSGEITLREWLDEDSKEKRYSVAISMANPFVDLFEGGADNEYNRNISLGFKDTQAKAKAQFQYKAKQALATCEKIDFTGFAERRKFYDLAKHKQVKYLAICIRSPFDDGEIGLTIPNAGTLGLFEMFANERLKPLGKK